MSRFSEVTGRATLREKVAPQIEIFWNHEDNSGEVKFWLKEAVYDKATGDYLGLEDCYDGGQLFRMPLAEVLADVTATPIGERSGMEMMLYVKALFDKKLSQP